jgi:outer membrane protein TolC
MHRACTHRHGAVKAELDRLRLAVDEATAQVIAAECELETARGVEREAAAARQTAEGERNAAGARLTEARAALDARLGIVTAPPPVRFAVPAPPAPVGDYEDDDDPVR